MERYFRLIIVLGCFTVSQGWSQDTIANQQTREYFATAIGDATPPVIDGIITDSIWDSATWGEDFIEWLPDENTPPTKPTKFKVLYDNKFLYFAARMYDEPDLIDNRLSRRDDFLGDRIAILIDSYNDKRNGFIFAVTASGVKNDEFVSRNGDDSDDSWNPIWYTAAKIDDEGWTVEMKIPFSQIKFGDSEEQIWGFQVARMLFRKNEWSVWDRIPREAAGWVSESGTLRGLLNIIPQNQLEIQPFVVSQYDTFPEETGNPFRDGDDFSLNAGLDAKIGITNDLNLDLTINPDFGQVDADPGAIALDGFQIFFQERRPFFVENKNIFEFGLNGGNDILFYSRRIGRNPQGSPNVLSEEYVEVPNNTTILGAAKFSGKTKNGWSIGVLESLTSKMYATVDNNGDRRRELVEPLTNYTVARLQKDFNERNSFIGGMFTTTHRNLEGNLDFLRKSAYSGGIDFKHNWQDFNYYLEGNFVMSHVEGSPEAIERTQRELTHLFQRTDAGHVEVDPTRTSLTGTGGRFEIGKAGGGNWRYLGGFNFKSPELELNDIGFLRQADEIRQYVNLGYRFLKPTKLYRDASLFLLQFSTYDFDGNFNRIHYEFNGDMSFANNWFIDLGGAHKPRIFSNTILRGGPRWRFSEENFFYVFAGTDRTKKFYTTLGYVNSQARQNNFSFLRYVLRFTYQPFDAFNLSVSTEIEDNPNKTQYVTETDFNGIPRYIMAEIDQKTLSTTIRFNYSINPNLSLQFYGQPFISRGRYSNFNYVNNAAAEDLSERVTLYNDQQINFSENRYTIDEDLNGTVDYSLGNPDFAFVQFRSNLVLRWEYIPGSEIFLVWSQGVTGFGDPTDSLGRSLDQQILGQQPENTFLLKATYRFIL